jgi:NAD(P)-dependent dehydrogenase (short-subunit alcohol dehydrogenase family)
MAIDASCFLPFHFKEITMSAQQVVIIGGSSGVGFATAQRLLEQGFEVTIAGRTQARLETAKTALRSAVRTLLLDAADGTAIPGAFSSIGSFNHLVLALGSGKGGGAFATVGLDDVRQGFAEKVFTHFACAQAALPFLAPRGSITFIAAVTAHAAMPGTAGLGAANAAIAALVPTLASELRPLRVNGVSPGVIDTPWWNFLPDEQKAAVFCDYAGKAPAARVGKPDDIAQVISFLISNTFMTGQTITCDGGLSLGS